MIPLDAKPGDHVRRSPPYDKNETDDLAIFIEWKPVEKEKRGMLGFTNPRGVDDAHLYAKIVSLSKMCEEVVYAPFWKAL